jgi:hypothetical protein
LVYEAETSLLCIGNERVELKLDKKTGFIKDIFCKETGIHHKDSENSGIWPFGLRLGKSSAPDLLRVEINERITSAKQEMVYNLKSKEEAQTLEMYYADLQSTGGNYTGVKLTVYITLKKGTDYFLIRAKVENNGEYEITKLFSGWGGLVADSNREKEILAVPDRSFGTLYHNPFDSFKEKETFGYPIMGSKGFIDAGWIDLYSEKGGIGVGYLNKQRLTMFFNVQRQNEGTGINWHLFNLFDQKADDKWDIVGGIYPINPGESFTSDQWILAPHAGDWHRMADIYRQEYEETFKGEYTTWEKTNEIAKKIDLTAVHEVYNLRGWPPLYKPRTDKKFSDVPSLIKKYIERSKVNPENLIVSVVGHSIHWCMYLPDWFPCPPEAGGDEGFKAMIAELRKMGVEAIMFYIHLHYNHPKANDYVAEADTGYDHQNVNWKQIGNVACVANKAWQKLWKEKYIPIFDEYGAPGVLIDEGAIQWLVCDNKKHQHGTKTVNVLSAQVKGIINILQSFKEGYKKRDPILWTEQGSDLQTPNVDIWSGHSGIVPDDISGNVIANGKTNKCELIRYTFPYRIVTVGSRKHDFNYFNNCLINGYIPGGYFGFSATYMWPKSVDPAISQYLRIRKELRDKKIPGYPQGFKDTVGLTVGNPNLVARVYRDKKDITVIYYAKKDVDTTIAVNKKALGFPEKNEVFQVNLKKNEASYKILRS